jgi:hypothetical protein
MTKKQKLAECLRRAPDFRMTFDRPGDVDTMTARWSDANGHHVIPMALGAHGRARVETTLLDQALGRMPTATP